MRTIGTQARGIRLPIIRKGDDLVEITVKSLLDACEEGGYSLRDRDVVGVTEAVLARAQGNYATIDQIASDVADKYPYGEVGIVFPIMSRNRFAVQLKAIAKGVEKIYVQLSYPQDEVGNPIITWDDIDSKGINPYTDTLTEEEFRELFGKCKHPYTGVDYIDLYREISDNITIIFSNDPRAILEYTKDVLVANVHDRERTRRILEREDVRTLYGLDDILTKPVDGSGFHPEYGLLGANKATEEEVKLFPRDEKIFVEKLHSRLKEETGKDIEVMIYGDGAFKDPVSGIWEMADPIVAPAYTQGLEGTPNEIKLKYIADNIGKSMTDEDLQEAIEERIRTKGEDLIGQMDSQGTTPRRYTDLLGSLCDLVSGSGDKGTPVVLVQGYFDNYGMG